MEHREANPYEGMDIRKLYDEAKKSPRVGEVATSWYKKQGETENDANRRFAMNWVKILRDEGNFDLADAIEDKANEMYS